MFSLFSYRSKNLWEIVHIGTSLFGLENMVKYYESNRPVAAKGINFRKFLITTPIFLNRKEYLLWEKKNCEEKTLREYKMTACNMSKAEFVTARLP